MSFAPAATLVPRLRTQPAAGPGFMGPMQTPVRYGPFSGARDTLRAMRELVLGPNGEKSLVVKTFTEWVLRDVEPKAYDSEIIAIRNVFLQDSPFRPGTPLIRYMNDPRHVEWIKSPERLVREIDQHGNAVADCDESSALAATMALQIGREVEFVALGFDGQLTHVGLRVREPKSGRWIWMDSVAGPRERDAAERAKQKLFWSLD